MGPDFFRVNTEEERQPSDISMNKHLVIAVLVALLAFSAGSSRVPRQAEDDVVPAEVEVVPEEVAVVEEVVQEEIVQEELVQEEVAEVPAEVEEVPAEVDVVPAEVAVAGPKGPVTRVTDTIKQYYASTVDTANSYMESIQGLKLEEKAKNLYDGTVEAASTYTGIIYAQIYHRVYPAEQ